MHIVKNVKEVEPHLSAIENGSAELRILAKEGDHERLLGRKVISQWIPHSLREIAGNVLEGANIIPIRWDEQADDDGDFIPMPGFSRDGWYSYNENKRAYELELAFEDFSQFSSNWHWSWRDESYSVVVIYK